MGDIADDLIDRAMDEFCDMDYFDDGYSPFTGRMPNRKSRKPPAKFYDNRDRGFVNGKLVPRQDKPKPRRTPEEQAIHAREFPGAHTDPALLPDYPPELFDMSHFPKRKPWNVSQEKPVIRQLRPALDAWSTDDEAPF